MHWMLWKHMNNSKTGDRHARLLQDGTERCDIADVFRYAKFKNATYKEDKVLGIYGILSKFGIELHREHLELKNDKIRDEVARQRQIFCAATHAIIKKTQSLKTLLYIPEHNRSVDLPSWVQDWFNDNPTWSSLRLEHCRASLDSRCSPELSSDQLTLTLRGKIIGQIDDYLGGSTAKANARNRPISNRDDSNHEKWWGLKRRAHIRILQRWTMMALHSWPWTPNEVRGRFFDTVDLMLDEWLDEDPEIKKNAQLCLFCALWRSITEHEKGLEWIRMFPNRATTVQGVVDPPLVYSQANKEEKDFIDAALAAIDGNKLCKWYYEALILKMEDYSLFKDSMGRIGLAFHTIQRHNKVILFEGASAPFIAAKNGCSWKLVAPASISGVMDGEQWDATENSHFHIT
jgi:hypothetical protein